MANAKVFRVEIFSAIFLCLAAIFWKDFAENVIKFIPLHYNITSLEGKHDNHQPLMQLFPFNWFMIGKDILCDNINTKSEQGAPWPIKVPIIITFAIVIYFIWSLYEQYIAYRYPEIHIFDDYATSRGFSSTKEFVKEMSLTSLEEQLAIPGAVPYKHRKIIKELYKELQLASLTSNSHELESEEFETEADLYALGTKQKAILFLGYGKCQYNNLKEAKGLLDDTVRELNKKYGEGEWFFVYGGDKYETKKHDLTHLIKRANRQGIDICAIQHKGVRDDVNNEEKTNSEIFGSNVKYTFWYEKDKDENGKTLYSGFDCILDHEDKPKLRGASRIYYGDPSFLSAVVAIGGGAFSLQDVKLGLYYKKPLLWMKCATKDSSLVWKGLSTKKCKSLHLGPVHSFVENAKTYLGRKGQDGMWYEPASPLELNDSRLRPYPIDNDMEEEIETTVSSVESQQLSRHRSSSRRRR